jgi:hypothetical protein
MKTAPFSVLSRCLLHALVFGSALSAPLSIGLAAPAQPKPDRGGEATHTLYMGADVSVKRGDKMYLVRDVVGSSFVIDVDGRTVQVPMREGDVSLKISENLKLEEGLIPIENLKGERAYTPQNDPNRRFRAQAASGMVADAGSDAAVSRLRDAQETQALLTNALPQIREAAAANAASAAAAIEPSFANTSGDLNNTGYYAARLQTELAQQLFDAMEVTFDVVAPTPLRSPYVIVITRFHEKGAKPGESRSWVLAKALEPLDGAPRKVRVFQGGMPPGYEIEKFDVHLYQAGREYPTSVSPKHVALSRQEAFEYLNIQYMSAHKGATLPPKRALASLSPELRTRLDHGELADTYFLKIQKDGQPVGIFVNEACSQAASDPQLQALARELRFHPALEKGKPVEAVVKLRLRELL